MANDERDQAPLGLGGEGFRPNFYDIAIFILIAGGFVLLAHGAHEWSAPAAKLTTEPIVLNPAKLPEYAFRTTLSMFAIRKVKSMNRKGTISAAAANGDQRHIRQITMKTIMPVTTIVPVTAIP